MSVMHLRADLLPYDGLLVQFLLVLQFQFGFKLDELVRDPVVDHELFVQLFDGGGFGVVAEHRHVRQFVFQDVGFLACNTGMNIVDH